MKVLIFHPTLVPPKDYGGTERILLWLTQGLREQGHDVWVAAYPGSRLPAGAQLIEVTPERSSPLDLLPRLPKGLDLIHFFTPPNVEAQKQMPLPYLLTLHGNGQKGEVFPENTVFLSRDHAQRHGAREFVYNGLDPSEYIFDPSKKNNSYLFLSKTSWRVKNLKGTLKLCRKARVPLKISGGDRPWLLKWQIQFMRQITWEGPVSGNKKALLLSQCKAFLFPVLWPEPFGVVVAEALVSGTPVLASRRGSLPELVSSDVGAILDTEDQWLSWLQTDRLPWEPEKCRARALELFHYRKMTENYEKIYRRVAAGEKLHERPPIAKEWSIG